MGVFSRNRSHLAGFDSSEIIANENYVGGVGAMQMVIEGYQNDHALFEAVLGMDFQEAAALNEGVELEVFTEASISSLFDKIKEFVKKAWEKIKGLFKTFLAKLDGIIMKDNKAFVDKYRRAVTAKDLSKMKYKWCNPTGKNITVKALTTIQSEVGSSLTRVKSMDENNLGPEQEKVSDSDYIDGILTTMLGETTDAKSFAKDFKSVMFEDEEKEEGLSSGRLLEIMGVLSEKKVISNIEKAKTESDRYFTKLLKQIDNISKDASKLAKSNDPDAGTGASSHKIDAGGNYSNIDMSLGTKTQAEKMFNRVTIMQKHVATYQTALNMFIGRLIEETKFHIKQCKRVFAQAASYNPKAVKENAILIEAVGEAAEYELHSLIESAEY